MTMNAPDWFRPQYENRAMHIYQDRGNRLRSTVTQATSFNDSNEAVFYIAGKSKAKKIGRNSTPEPGGGDRKKFTAPLETWQAFDEIVGWDLDRLALNEREVVYESGAMALGRATDKEIYDKMYAAVPAVTPGLDFSDAAFSAPRAMLLARAVKKATKLTDGQIYCGLPEYAWDELLANKVVHDASVLGAGASPFTMATESRFWHGVNWFLNMEEDDEDFYHVPEADKADAFIWHKSAMGWGNKEELTVIPQYENRMQGGGGWTINMLAKGGATTLQEGRGVVRFRLKTNATLAIV